MDENKKKFDWKSAAIVVMAVLLIACLSEINEVSNTISVLQHVITGYRDQVSGLENKIDSIYHNVDNQLKKEASLVSGVDFAIGDISEDMKSVELALTVMPKLVTEDMEVTISVDGNSAPLTWNGNGYTGTVEVGLFVDYDQWPMLSIKSAEGTKTEYLDNIDISYLYNGYLPSVCADMTAHSAMKDGKLQVDAGFSIESKPAYENAPITFVSFTLIEEVNGEEINRTDITDDVRKSVDGYNTRYVRSFEISQGDELKVYLVAEDSLGYIHKTLTHFWTQSEDGSTAEVIPSIEMIYDKDGNLLYGEKVLWG